jgi:hypothetical protein
MGVDSFDDGLRRCYEAHPPTASMVPYALLRGCFAAAPGVSCDMGRIRRQALGKRMGPNSLSELYNLGSFACIGPYSFSETS